MVAVAIRWDSTWRQRWIRVARSFSYPSLIYYSDHVKYLYPGLGRWDQRGSTPRRAVQLRTRSRDSVTRPPISAIHLYVASGDPTHRKIVPCDGSTRSVRGWFDVHRWCSADGSPHPRSGYRGGALRPTAAPPPGRSRYIQDLFILHQGCKLRPFLRRTSENEPLSGHVLYHG